ncbi:universal stress protein [Flexivirga caeni]|nr:universal stress protein [Flexivirga caeni]
MEGSVQPESVVVGVDTSTSSLTALDWAIAFAHETQSAIHLVHAFSHDHPDLAFNMGTGAEDLRAVGDEVIEHAIDRIRLQDNDIHITIARSGGYPAAALVRASRNARIVVVGALGDSLSRLSPLGETAHQVAAHSQCPVAVIRPSSGSDYGRITVGVDRSDGSHKALDWAFTRAEQTGRELLVLHAWQPRDAEDPALGVASWEEYTTQCRSDIGASVADQQSRHPSVKVLTEIADGKPVRRLIELAHSSDLVVVGARGHGGFESLALGRVAGEVLGHAPSSVVAVH